jgi:myo-inositol-1(or 4)-monophosphatase
VSELDIALQAARAAARILVEHSAGPRRVDHKGVIDLVTEVDLACEAAVRRVLEQHTPEVPILGEEEGGPWEAPTRWVLDPLDGTTNFVHGFPSYAVSLALEVDGRATVGVVIDPVRGAEYTAVRGQGAYRDGVRLAVSSCDRLQDALLGTGFPYDRHDRAPFYLARVEAFMRRCQGIRRAGAAAMDLCFMAQGSLDGFWEFSLSPWDVAAGVLLVEEAGGRVSAHDGGPLDPRRPSPLVSNGHLHDAMMHVLAEVNRRSPS